VLGNFAVHLLTRRRRPPRAALKLENPGTFASFSAAKAKYFGTIYFAAGLRCLPTSNEGKCAVIKYTKEKSQYLPLH
jgi:hypothetical protein